jgi:hypothetical protein
VVNSRVTRSSVVAGYVTAAGATGSLLTVLGAPVRLLDTRPTGVAGGASATATVQGAGATAGVLSLADLYQGSQTPPERQLPHRLWDRLHGAAGGEGQLLPGRHLQHCGELCLRHHGHRRRREHPQ